MNQFLKHPQARLDFGFDLKPRSHARPGALNPPVGGDWLAEGERVASYTLRGEGVDVEDGGEADGLITAWVSGGTAGATARLTCTWTTSAGRVDSRAIWIAIKER